MVQKQQSVQKSQFLWDDLFQDPKQPTPESSRPSPKFLLPSKHDISQAQKRLQDIAQQVHTRFFSAPKTPVSQACFYPYAGLKHTIRQRKNTILLKISDLLYQADQAILEAITAILYHRFLRLTPPKHILQRYRAYEELPEVRKLRNVAEQERARAAGSTCYDMIHPHYRQLQEHVEKVYQQFFDGEFPVPSATWSKVKAKTRLGVCNIDRSTILINPRLDSKRVPIYVLEYVIYHEMLHLRHGVKKRNGGRREIHGMDFSKDEQIHPDYQRAESFIKHKL